MYSFDVHMKCTARASPPRQFPNAREFGQPSICSKYKRRYLSAREKQEKNIYYFSQHNCRQLCQLSAVPRTQSPATYQRADTSPHGHPRATFELDSTIPPPPSLAFPKPQPLLTSYIVVRVTLNIGSNSSDIAHVE
jgi:hypothetical protein